MISLPDIVRRLAFGTAALLFVFAASVQFNDPDPWFWVLAYGLGAGVGAAEAVGWRPPKFATGGFALAGLVLGAYLGWIYLSGQARPMFESAPDEEMRLLSTEEGREMVGMLIVAAVAAASSLRADSERH